MTSIVSSHWCEYDTQKVNYQNCYSHRVVAIQGNGNIGASSLFTSESPHSLLNNVTECLSSVCGSRIFQLSQTMSERVYSSGAIHTMVVIPIENHVLIFVAEYTNRLPLRTKKNAERAEVNRMSI